MEDISERRSRLGIPRREIIPVNDVSFQSNPEDLSATYQRIMASMEDLLFFRNRSFDRNTEISTIEPEPFFLFNRISYEDFIVFLEEEEECQRPRQAPRKARRRHDPPPRVSRRSSQVSPPIYLRHRFLPQSRKDSSSRRRQR